MVEENFEIFMSEMPENVANCQKSDFPPTDQFFIDFHSNLWTSNYDARG